MTPICLLDSDRLTDQLRDALSWTDTVSALLVSARNGSVLACAFRNTSPSIRDLRTKSATITAAYTAASESTLVFASPGDDGQITVIAPVADHLLLTVCGGEREQSKHRSPDHRQGGETLVPEEQITGDEEGPDEDENHEQLRADLESVSQELAASLREELADLKWPDDI